MKIIFGGTNIDSDVIERIRRGELVDRSEVTPEIVPAAYARVSRDSRSVTELRSDSRKNVAKARKSNQRIYFDMGHHSVAEHGIINLDIIEISRLAIEALESHRIGVAYTEKSQRYLLLTNDYTVPKELKEIPHFTQEFHDSVQRKFDLYHRAFPILLKFHRKENPKLSKEADENKNKGVLDKNNRAKNTLEGFAKEDARYVLSMAMQGQLGFSANFRALEYIIRTLRYSPLAEVREMSQRFYEIGSEQAPSLIKLCDAKAFEEEFGRPLEEDFIRNFNATLKEESEKFRYLVSEASQIGDVRLLCYDEYGDHRVIAGLLSKGLGKSYESAYNLALKLIEDDKAKDYLLRIFVDLTEFDNLPREFELSSFTYHIVTSATNFAQLKRHRIMTLLPGRYDPGLGYTIPESISKTGLEKYFIEEINRSSELFDKIKSYNPYLAEYFLTNAHRRENIVQINLRELYHLSRLREDKHAQWDIRATAKEMVSLAKSVNPLTTMFLGGKDQFKQIKARLYQNE